jgi:hypothetical protein
LGVLGFLAWLICLSEEHGGAFAETTKLFLSKDRVFKYGFLIGVLYMTSVTGKGPNPVASLFRVLFWHGQDWVLASAFEDNTTSQQAVATSTNAIRIATNTAAQVTAFVETNNVVTLSFDWHSPNRLPYHDRQNVLGRTVWVQPTNILGVLYEDHYVAFNESATTNPAVILIEYARDLGNGTVERYSSATITNSFPVMFPIAVQSGVHTCYWFRCEVPAAFINCCVRDWNGEALFGSPDGSEKGFDLLGTLLIDDGDNIWEGATTNMVVNGVTNTVKNGIILEAQ